MMKQPYQESLELITNSLDTLYKQAIKTLIPTQQQQQQNTKKIVNYPMENSASPMNGSIRRTSPIWTLEENQVFEKALADFGPTSPDFFGVVEQLVTTKTRDHIVKHYNDLIIDLQMIEAGLIELPVYRDVFDPNAAVANAQQQLEAAEGDGPQLAKKGLPWTPEEHEKFLQGFKKYGKGHWRTIAREYVMTRTPAQVASHAQKHILKQLGSRRKSKGSNTVFNLEQLPGIGGASSSNASSNMTGDVNPNPSDTIMQDSNLIQAIQFPPGFNAQENEEFLNFGVQDNQLALHMQPNEVPTTYTIQVSDFMNPKQSNLQLESLSSNMMVITETSGSGMQVSTIPDQDAEDFNMEASLFGDFGPSGPFFNQEHCS